MSQCNDDMSQVESYKQPTKPDDYMGTILILGVYNCIHAPTSSLSRCMAALAKPFQLLLAGQSTLGGTKADIV